MHNSYARWMLAVRLPGGRDQSPPQPTERPHRTRTFGGAQNRDVPGNTRCQAAQAHRDDRSPCTSFPLGRDARTRLRS